VRVEARDRDRLEHLCRHAGRAAIAENRPMATIRCMLKQTHVMTILASLSFLGTAVGQNGWTMPSPSTPPPALRLHELAFDAARGRTVLFGGWQPSIVFGSTWEWDGANWTSIVTANAPAPRFGHAMAFHPGTARVVLFGGADSSIATDLGDTWQYDGVNWQQVFSTHQPSPRRLAEMALDPTSGKLLLFGGGVTSSAQPEFGETWLWDGTDWRQRRPAHSPPPRVGHAMATDFRHRTVVLFGGISSQQPMIGGETWVWNGADWHNPMPSAAPLGRQQHAMSWNEQSQTVVMNGGNNADVSTWHWDGSAWYRDLRAPWFYLTSPFAMTYDSWRHRNIVFGEAAGQSPQTWEYAPGALARWTPGNGGCAGPQGTPTLQPAAGSRPKLPSIFDLELHYGSGSAAGLLVFGLGRSPQSLGGLGMPGCVLDPSPDVMVLLQQSGGTAVFPWVLPNTSALNGIQVHAQGFVGDPAANAAGALVSNEGTMLLGSV